MWRDVSNAVSLQAGKIIHDSQAIGELSYGCISVFAPRYRVRMERGCDQEGYFNKFFVEKDFEAYELQETAISNREASRRPFVLVRAMKFLDVTHRERELFINVDAICVIERLVANKCKISLKTGQVLELEYDATRIRKKLEELEPESVLRV